MKKAILTALVIASSVSMASCSRGTNLTTPNMPGTANTTTDPNAGYIPTTGTTSDPYGTGAYPGTTGATYPTGTTYPSATDPYGTGANPYGQNTGYPNTGYPNTGVANPYGQTNGQVVINPATGQPMIDPMTGQPMVSNGLSAQLTAKITAAGGYKGSKADDEVVAFLKTNSVQQVFAAAPLTDRALAIKSLLDGWCTAEEKNYAQQIWNTILPQDQQTILSQDSELNKLVTSKLLQGKSNGVGSILSEIGKMVGLK